MLHNIHEHEDKPRTYVRLLFIDFSSAFNTIQHHIMIQKLLDMTVNANLIMWINNLFLTGKKQSVRFKCENCSTITIITLVHATRMCVYPLVSLYCTHLIKCASPNNGFILKYADDTVIVGLLGG